MIFLISYFNIQEYTSDGTCISTYKPIRAFDTYDEAKEYMAEYWKTYCGMLTITSVPYGNKSLSK